MMRNDADFLLGPFRNMPVSSQCTKMDAVRTHETGLPCRGCASPLAQWYGSHTYFGSQSHAQRVSVKDRDLPARRAVLAQSQLQFFIIALCGR